jgi:uncharacterized protein (DUF427 family)
MSMAKAIWKGAVLAESDQTVVVEGNQYFPKESVRSEYLKPSDTHSVCFWKETASYYDVEVGGERNTDAAWYYPEPKPAAKESRIMSRFGRACAWKPSFSCL